MCGTILKDIDFTYFYVFFFLGWKRWNTCVNLRFGVEHWLRYPPCWFIDFDVAADSLIGSGLVFRYFMRLFDSSAGHGLLPLVEMFL